MPALRGGRLSNPTLTTREKHLTSAVPVIDERQLADVSAEQTGRCMLNMVEVLENYPAKVQIMAVACLMYLMSRRCTFHVGTLVERCRAFFRYPTQEMRGAELYTINQIK
jgi:hypothetical protein